MVGSGLHSGTVVFRSRSEDWLLFLGGSHLKENQAGQLHHLFVKHHTAAKYCK